MFEISINNLFKYMKVRYLIIGLLLIVFTPLFSYYLPLVPSFEPEYSIYSTNDLGGSNLLPILNKYEVDRSHKGDFNVNLDYDLVIINTPQRIPDFDYVLSIRNLYFSGTRFMFIGSENMASIMDWFDIQIANDPTGDSRIFDTQNNGGEMVYPELQGYSIPEIYGVVPTSALLGEEPQERITTSTTSAYAICWDEENPCLASYTIGAVFDNFAFVADQFMFKNSFTSLFPSNLLLFERIIQEMIGDGGRILVDESYLNWAPVNKEGVENFVFVRLDFVMIIVLITIFSFIIPLIVGFQTNIFGSEPRKRKSSESFSTLEKRLAYIHIERLPAAPLNLLERTLMEEKLRYSHRGKFYFQYLAEDLHQYILTRNFDKLIPQSYLLELNELKNGFFSELSSWELIGEIYNLILTNSLYKQKGELL